MPMKRTAFTVVLAVAIGFGCHYGVRVEESAYFARPAYRSDAADRLDLPDSHEEPVDCSWVRSSPAVLKVHFLDVGQGDCTLIECPNGQTILVDSGSLSRTADVDYDSIRNYVQERLRSEFVGDAQLPWLDLLVITHPDRDHYNLLPFVLEGVWIDRAALVGEAGEYSARLIRPPAATASMVSWITVLDERGAAVWLDRFESPYFNPLDEPSDLFDCGEAGVFVLAAGVPATTSADNFVTNTRSIVLRITHGEVDIILTGDATWDTERKILDRYTQESELALVSEVLMLGHHGSRATSTSPEWAEAIRPRTAIASASGTRFGHPAKDVIERIWVYTDDDDPPHDLIWGVHVEGSHFEYERLEGVRESVYATASNGTIVVETDGLFYCVSFER